MIAGLRLALASAVATSVGFLLSAAAQSSLPLCRPATRCAARPASFARVRSRSAGGSPSAPGTAPSARSALAPLSIVQAVLSGGLVFLAVFAERFFGFRLGRRQWAGVTLTALGLAVIGLTSESATKSPATTRLRP